jgi:hypothetical protein
MPGHATMNQAFGFAEALVRGQRDHWDIIKTVLKDKIREVVLTEFTKDLSPPAGVRGS